MIRSAFLLLMSSSLIMPISGCSPNKEKPESDAHSVDSIFNYHFTILINAINEKTATEGKENYARFNTTIDFLQETTGIPSQRKGTYIGPIYTTDTALKEDYRKWRTWYDQHKSRLRMDGRSGRIVLSD